MDSEMYSKVCFVIMPFGRKKIGEQIYDFDYIYESTFKIAIESVSLPEGVNLVPKRADSSPTSGSITYEMFRDILYSRIVLADITGENPNVFYELGVRHSLRPTSTVVIKETHANIPFDIKDLNIIPYDTSQSGETFRNSKRRIREALEACFTSNPKPNPIALALREDLEWPEYGLDFTKRDKIRSWIELKKEDAMLKEFIREAELAVENRNIEAAISSCKGARMLAPDDLRVNMQLGMLLKKEKRLKEAEIILKHVTLLYPMYSPAWRELGVVENKMERATDAIHTIEKALKLNPHDTDAWCSLGGVHKTTKNYADALKAYQKGLDESPHSTYALLNYLTMVTVINKKLPNLIDRKKQLNVAIKDCLSQIEKKVNLPWCHYDLAQIYFFTGDETAFKIQFEKGIENSNSDLETTTAKETYTILEQADAIPEKFKPVIELITGIIDKKWPKTEAFF